jgi:general secretion pathway protein K
MAPIEAPARASLRGGSHRLPSKPRPKGSIRPGFALIAVLWLLLILGVIGGMLLRGADSERELAATEVALSDARLLADAGINRAIMSLANAEDPLKWRLDGTKQIVHLLDHDIEVSVESEAAKIDLNLAPRDLLAALIRTRGVAPGDAGDIADRIVAWRSPLQPGEPDQAADAYRDAGRSYAPTHSPFRSTDELRLVLGMTDALQAAVSPAVTVYSRSAAVDRQVAGDLVLQSLKEAGDALAGSQADARNQGQASGIDRAPVLGEALTIDASVAGDGVTMQRSAVIRVTGDRRAPYWVLAWR